MSESESSNEPKRSYGDAGHTVVRAVLSMIPVVGGPAVELFAFLVAPPLEKWRDEWIQSVSDGLHALEQKFEDFRIKDVSENEVFISTLINATRAGIATHQEEMRLALRNAVLNAALPQAPDEIRQKMFIKWLDELTPWHLKILRLFDHPEMAEIDLDKQDWMINLRVTEIANLIESNYPEMGGRENFGLYMQIIKDLHSLGLIANRFPAKDRLTKIERSPVLTPLARKFLAFVKSPLKE